MNISMPVNPHTGLYNVTREEVADALAATDDVLLVRPDGTLTVAGQAYVADMRTIGHEDCERCFDPTPEPVNGETWDDYALVCEAMEAADVGECAGCEDEDNAPHWRMCPRWDAPENGAL